MNPIRKPVVAGAFYPESQEQLREDIQKYLAKAEVPSVNKDILGIVSPHAGYMYSGACAAHGYKAIQSKNIEIAIVLSPCHHAYGFEYALGEYTYFETPLGKIPVAEDILDLLNTDKAFDFIPEVYDREHALEVQLPFLQIISPKIKIVPIIIGNQCLANSEYLAEKLLHVLEPIIDKTIVVASSDLSHYHSAVEASEKDTRLITSFLHQDRIALAQDIKSKATEACGFGCILTLMSLAEKMNYQNYQTLKYTHSGNVSGDMKQVVGYFSGIISR